MQIKLALVCECSARGTAQGRDRPCFIKRDRPRFFEFLAKRKKKLAPRANNTYVGMRMFSTRQGQTLFYKKGTNLNFYEFLAKRKKNSRLVQTTLTLVCECSARGKAQGRDRPCFIKRDRPRFSNLIFTAKAVFS